MSMTWKRRIAFLLRIVFGLLLIAASIDKILHPFGFAEAVANYGVLGDGLSRWVAIWVPMLEAITGILLLIGVWKDATTSITAILMVVFLVLIAQAYARGLDIACGCFRVESEANMDIWKLMENIAFAVGSVAMAVLTFGTMKRA